MVVWGSNGHGALALRSSSRSGYRSRVLPTVKHSRRNGNHPFHEEPLVEEATDRRRLLSFFLPGSMVAGSSWSVDPRISHADVISPSDTIVSSSTTAVTLPLEYVPALGGSYVVHYTLFGERFGAIVDTGSPFLIVPSTCNPNEPVIAGIPIPSKHSTAIKARSCGGKQTFVGTTTKTTTTTFPRISSLECLERELPQSRRAMVRACINRGAFCWLCGLPDRPSKSPRHQKTAYQV